jgi:hypothetical protein
MEVLNRLFKRHAVIGDDTNQGLYDINFALFSVREFGDAFAIPSDKDVLCGDEGEIFANITLEFSCSN